MSKARVTENQVKNLLFYLENHSKKDFSSWLTGVNIFEVLKISSAEIRHSNVLAWLMNPRENHNLGDGFVEKLLLRILEQNENVQEISSVEVYLNDFSDGKVFRESENNIDILFSSESNKFNIIVENKTFTSDHDDQLKKYRAYVSKNYPDFRNLYIYLTPYGSEPVEASEEEKLHWKLLSYQEIFEILETLVEDEEVDGKVKYILKEYNDNLRRNILQDEQLLKLSAEIYFKHKEVLDLIMGNLPDEFEEVKKEFLNALLDLNSDGRIIFSESDLDIAWRGKRGNSKGKEDGHFRFRTKTLDDFLENQVLQGETGWKTGSQYYYEVTINSWTIENRYTYVTLSEENIEKQDHSHEKTEFIKDFASRFAAKRFENGYFVIKDFSKIGKSYEEMRKDLSGEVHSYLQGILKEITEFETELLKKWEEKQAG